MKSSKTFGISGLWGELPVRETHKQEVITPDIIENVWRQVLDETNNSDCDYMDYENDTQSEFIQLPLGNVHVLNTVHLHQQLRDMDDGTIIKNLTMIHPTESSQQLPESDNLLRFVLPRMDKNGLKNFPAKHTLQPAVAHNVLKHAVIVLLAHIGFEKSSDTAIETLTDIAKLFLRRITLLLKLAAEQKDDSFPDAMERVLVESGIGGVVALHNYYQEYIVRFEENVKLKAEKVVEEQRQMEISACNAKMELDEMASKFQFEELDAFGNVYREVPTLQLLDPEMGFPPSLDAGFQMLHSLEQDELNSLEVEEEEVSVNDSPSVGHQRSTSTSEKKKK